MQWLHMPLYEGAVWKNAWKHAGTPWCVVRVECMHMNRAHSCIKSNMTLLKSPWCWSWLCAGSTIRLWLRAGSMILSLNLRTAPQFLIGLWTGPAFLSLNLSRGPQYWVLIWTRFAILSMTLSRGWQLQYEPDSEQGLTTTVWTWLWAGVDNYSMNLTLSRGWQLQYEPDSDQGLTTTVWAWLWAGGHNSESNFGRP